MIIDLFSGSGLNAMTVFSPCPLSRSLWSPRCDCRCSPWPCMKSPSHSCKPHQRHRQRQDESAYSLGLNLMQMRSCLDCGEAVDRTISCQRKKELKHFTCHLKLWSLFYFALWCYCSSLRSWFSNILFLYFGASIHGLGLQIQLAD